MDQLCDSWDGKVLRFDSSRDDWEALFTDRDYQVYSLMIAGCKNAKIASILNISERTVKYFCGLIYQKLGVSTRAEALNKAAELGDI
jgi:ATP/maltotriose-dependent transcriptional regulator MalT